MRLLGTFQLVLLAALLFSLFSGFVASLVLPSLLRRCAAWAPSARARTLALVSVAPVGCTFFALSLVLLPSVLSAGYDHCLIHDDQHPHLCFFHPPPDAGSPAGWALLALVGGSLVPSALSGVSSFIGSSRLLKRLFGLARFDGRVDAGRGGWVVPSELPLCLTVGLLRPRLLLSEGLLRTTSQVDLAVMMAHEGAHRRRRDTLVQLLARLAGAWLLPKTRRRLLGALRLAAEQACDEEAATRIGNRLQVARTILKAERRLAHAHPPEIALVASGFGPSSTVERVEALLEPPKTRSAFRMVVGSFALVIALMLAAHEPLHHATESVLALLRS